MLPELADLLDGFELYAKRHQMTPGRNEPALREALLEAAMLARNGERDEPAALFFSLCQRPRSFGKLHGDLILLCAAEQAHSIGLELRIQPVELQILRLRIVRGEMSFAEVCARFAERLHPAPRRPWPPR